MDKISQKLIDLRQTANRQIVGKIYEVVELFPDLRFGQILVNLGIIDYEYDELGCIRAAKDPFNEESVITLYRIKNGTK